MQVGDRFPVEELGLSESNGRLVVYIYPQAGTAGRGTGTPDRRLR